MLELPTIKTDFLFENSQDFNQTTHARPQHPIVFIDNISLYFNCISSVKYVFKWSRHSFFCGTTKAGGGKSAYTHFGMQIILLFSKWQPLAVMTQTSKGLIRKYFICYIIF